MVFKLDIPRIIPILFSFVLFLKYVGGTFHIVNIAIPMALIIIISIIYNVHTKKLFDDFSYVTFLLFFIFYLFIGSFYSMAPNYGREKTIMLFSFFLITVVSAKFIILHFNLFLKSNLFFFILFVVAYFGFYGSFGNVLKMLSPMNRLEMGGEVFGYISSSQYIGFSIISLFCLLFQQDANVKFRKLIFGFLFSIGIFMMILFGSKGPILSLILAPLIFFLFHRKNDLKKVSFLVIAIIGISFILLYPESILKLIPQKYQVYFEYRFFNFDHYIEDRPSLYQVAISDIDQKSFLFGKGTGNYGFLFGHKDVKVYPHNIFVELLYENGLFGLLLFIIILFRYRNIKSTFKYYVNNRTYLLVLVYYFLMCAQVSGDFSNNFALFIFLILTYYLINSEKKMLRIIQIVNESSLEVEV